MAQAACLAECERLGRQHRKTKWAPKRVIANTLAELAAPGTGALRKRFQRESQFVSDIQAACGYNESSMKGTIEVDIGITEDGSFVWRPKKHASGQEPVGQETAR